MALLNYKYNKHIQINYNQLFFFSTLHLGVFLSSESELVTVISAEPLR